MGYRDGRLVQGTNRRERWFPFSLGECEVALGIVGLLAAGLAAFDVAGDAFALLCAAMLLCAYVIGLLAYAASNRRGYAFIEDGGLQGLGYVPYFQQATRSLFVTHADDDEPAAELLGLYERLLGRGVSIRRVVFERPGKSVAQLTQQFGCHPQLSQRIVRAPAASSMPMSFAVVDEAVVIVSLPGASGLDAPGYSSSFVLRHLLVLADREVARVFLRMHERLWGLGRVTAGRKA